MITRLLFASVALGALVSFSSPPAAYAQASKPIVTDSRIKTFVFNENDVYSLLTHYGYQSNIEFGKKETIETISIGDRVGWQIVPAGRRLFIRAMEENAHTNMTVVTNKRAYQFDLRSSSGDNLPATHELVYVVRFFYPEDALDGPNPPIYSDDIAAADLPPAPAAREMSAQFTPPSAPKPPAAKPPAPTQTMASAPAPSMPAPTRMPPAPAAATPPAPTWQPSASSMPSRLPSTQAITGYNYRYTFSGPNDIAPVKIYDDGQSTYFKFRSYGSGTPHITALLPDGREIPVQAAQADRNTLVVSMTAPRFALRSGSRQVTVYNERQYSGL